jgi:hypothetical protein
LARSDLFGKQARHVGKFVAGLIFCGSRMLSNNFLNAEGGVTNACGRKPLLSISLWARQGLVPDLKKDC